MGLSVKQMHVGIDLALQNLNSNLHGTFLPEEKDYFLNSVTNEFLRILLYREDPAPRGYLSLTDIKNYYSVLQHYIVNTKLELVQQDEIFHKAVFPQYPVQTELITKGLLYSGIKYKVTVVGTELNTFGALSVPLGGTFVCTIPNIKSTTVTLKVGSIYKILKAGSIDYTAYGATSNDYGTVFTCNEPCVAVLDSGGFINELEVIADSPASSITTVYTTARLKQLATINYYYLVSSNSIVRGGSPIMSGRLVKGVSYVIDKVGTTDFSTIGGYANNVEGTVFKCTVGVLQTTPNRHILDPDVVWEDGTIIYELKPVVNRIVKPEDVKNLLTNAFGTTISSPLCTMSDLNLNVYTNNNFDVYDVEAMYIKEPIAIDFNNDVDSDLPALVHELLVELTAKKIAGWTGGGGQQAQQQ